MKALPATEIFGWMEYFLSYPFKIVADYEQAAMIAHTVANSALALAAQRAGKRTFKPVDLDFFLPKFLKQKKQASKEQQHSEWSAFVADAKNKLGQS